MKKDIPTMIEIGDKVVTLDLITEKFVCNLDVCKGVCCVHGESGAPLESEEVDILDNQYPDIAPFLREEGNSAIQKQGTWVIDTDKESVTPLIEGNECAYAIFEKGIARCGIEKAFEAGATTFRKPVSCHIYPIRVKRYKGFTALNYDRWKICDPARAYGEEKDVPVYRFLQESIVRKYGEEFYKKLEIISHNVGQNPDPEFEP
ncbi:DUF3109 family protein [Bacteroidota bacterium]